MNDHDLEMKSCFLDEATDLLANAEQCFLNFEKSKDDPNVIEEIFRLAHNLKGSAGAVGFVELAEFAHRLESFLLKIKVKEVSVTNDVISLLLACNDCLCEAVEKLKSNPKAVFDHSHLSQGLNDTFTGEKGQLSQRPKTLSLMKCPRMPFLRAV